MKFGIVVFPGTWSEKDTYYAISNVLGHEARYIWHKDRNISNCDAIVIPGGFSYGDFLRCGAIARFSPVMDEVIKFSKQGRPVIGICNGFQILCETGLLPGALVRNNHLEFRCEWVNLRVERAGSPFTNLADVGQILRVPISHGEGNWQADDRTIALVEEQEQVALRYIGVDGLADSSNNPNGSVNNIAGLFNRNGNVMGMMPHPEKACEDIIGGSDGNVFFQSIAETVASV